jgi:hypothetical protein
MRLLKSLRSIKSLKTLIESIVESLEAILSVALFLTFTFFVMAVLNLQLFNKSLHYRCRLTEEPDYANDVWPIDEDVPHICGFSRFAEKCPTGTWCGEVTSKGLSTKHENTTDSKLVFYGNSNFDHIGMTLFTLFQVLTQEGWGDLMFRLSETDTNFLNYITISSAMLIGSFLLINLILAALMEKFESKKRNQ